MRPKAKICVIGAGYWGKNHIRTLNDLHVLGGIVEENSDLLSYVSKEYPKIKTYNKLKDALNNNEYSGFTVATPAETHHDIAVKIIQSGKHVLVEKPLALNVQDAQNLKSLSEKYSVNLMVGHVLLFHPAIRKIKELIQNGKIGRLQYIYSNRLNLGQVKSKENVFWSLAPHDISIFQYITESYPEKINATGSIFLQKGIQDSTITHLQYPNGVKGHIFVSWLHPFKEHRLVAIGSDAMISFDDSEEGKPLKLYSKKYNIKEGVPGKVDGPVEIIKYDNKMPLTEELKYFSQNINGTKLKIADAAHALEVTKILVEASSQLGRNE